MDTKNFLDNGGRIFRREEVNSNGVTRIITVAYHRVDDGIHYGASIHRQENKSDTFFRKPHNHTAVERCMLRPVVIPDVHSDTKFDVEEYIRGCMFKLGVRGPRA